MRKFELAFLIQSDLRRDELFEQREVGKELTEPLPEDKPDIMKLLPGGSLRVQSLILTLIFVLLLFYTLYFAKPFLLPIVLAILLSLLLGPVVRALKRIKIPEAVGAGLVILAVVATLIFGVVKLSEPASRWMAELPRTMKNVGLKLKTLREPMQKVNRAAKEVEKMTEIDQAKNQQVEVKEESLLETIIAEVSNLLTVTVMTLILLYFLLASGDLFLRKLIKVLSTWSDKKIAVEIARQTESHISVYLSTVTIINVVLGVAVAISLKLIGVPNPVLWGILAAVTNFVPYIGALFTAAILALVGVVTFESVTQALIAPAVFLFLTSVEGYFVTPMVLGKRFTLNPVMVFTSLLFWGWLWGIPGALLAVPMLATFKIFCDHIESLAAIGEFLSE
jgi:predicted PurR-regulated permease PerM